MGAAESRPDPLLGGFYTVADAARLLQIENKQRIYAWLQGRRGGAEPIILRDYIPIDSAQELSFCDLMEVRFINHFRRQGLSLQLLRKIAANAREKFDSDHPFALSNIVFMTDRKGIFEKTIEESGEVRVKKCLGEQYEMYPMIEDALAKGITFDPKTHLAGKWVPFPSEFPDVVVDPQFSYGQPVVGEHRVPTSALFRSWKAEGGDQVRVADWYRVSEDSMRQAIEFEVKLAA
ncbi:MAG: hypothetical protein RL186_406 [Pseudomonadota bacterium]|jgi:uncharacterized protein (DUF433 family)